MSITPAFLRRFAYGLALLAGLAGLCGLFSALLSVASSRGRPQAPVLELHLELAKPRWKEGEYLWYHLDIANVGNNIAPIYDHFWVDQEQQEKNWEEEQGTYLQITDSQGKESYVGTTWDVHGIFFMWENDLSGYRPPKGRGVRGILDQLHRRGIIPNGIFWPIFQKFMEKWDKPRNVIPDPPILLLRPGERFTATPSVVKAVDPSSRNPRHLGLEGDPRMIPYAPRGWSRDQVEQLKQTWKQETENQFLWGGWGFKRDPRDLPPPSGFRILEKSTLHLKPGKYRIKVIYDTRAKLPALSAEEEIARGQKPRDSGSPNRRQEFINDSIKKWKATTPADLEKLREQRRKIEAANKNEVYVESNTVDIEVVR